MALETKDGDSKELLRAVDTGLPLLAARAAIELDNLTRKMPTELTATKHLASLLSNSLKEPEGSVRPHTLMDSSTMALMSRALNASDWGRPIRTVADLSEEARILVVKLEDPSASNKELLGKLRRFCVALGECAVSHLQSIYAQRPAHPYRR